MLRNAEWIADTWLGILIESSIGLIDLCHAFEYLMLALCKYQKWKEKVRISKYRKFGDLILKTMAFVEFLKTENSTKNIWEFYVGRALMPVQPRYHANAHTVSFKILEYV